MFKPKGGYQRSDERRKNLHEQIRANNLNLQQNILQECADIPVPAAKKHFGNSRISTGSVDLNFGYNRRPQLQKEKKISAFHSTYKNVNEDDDLSSSDNEEDEEEGSSIMQNMDRCKGVETSVIRSSKGMSWATPGGQGHQNTTLFGYRTVEAGNQIMVWNKQGVGTVVEGPARITLWRSRVEEMERFIAGQGEYLVVQYKAGEKKVMAGPCSIFFNPIEHFLIEQRSAIFINSGECMVIYRMKEELKSGNGGVDGVKKIDTTKPDDAVSCDSNDVERAIKYGPCQYIPQPDEWIHEFKWHGSDAGDKTRKSYGSLTFTKLRIIADQTYYNVREVRTKDDTLLTVKLMMFFQLADINKMLDNTHDPIGDFINAACSDVVAFCAGLTYEEFLEKTSILNELSTFKQLQVRADAIGYQINKVVFRGFHSSDALQAMHDKSIQERTKLRLETDTEHQRQSHIDYQLEKEEERSGRERALETQADAHQRKLKAANHAEELKQKREWHEHEMHCQKEWQEVHQAKLAKLSELGVNLTELLVAKEKVPDKIYRIEGKDGGAPNGVGNDVRLHLHEDSSKLS